eukprot:TRINITY_DN5387_c0_g1_i1.p1 TRINITY_DN5387_c0_g1~~TRINITY_DN5387_c0_g1_i1.p1  ORF type:complete len:329 (-),score=28.95 TRINITY_DN5387_c0_g1_i1:145-1131(-)
MIRKGGHTLILIVGDTDASTIYDGRVDMTGPPVGLKHIIKGLRDKRLDIMPGTQPPVVILCELMPRDWLDIINADKVFFVRGNPMDIKSLQSAGFLRAKGIGIVRMHHGTIGNCEKVSDSRLVLAAHMIQSMMPPTITIPIVTDHAYAGTFDLLPKDRVHLEEGPLSLSYLTGPPAELPRAVRSLWGGEKAISQSNGLDGKPSPNNTTSVLSGETSNESWEEMEIYDIKFHPRYMRGQAFHPSALTSMVANSLYNPTLISMVDALIEAPMFVIDVPRAWEHSRYIDWVLWLMRERNLMSMALIRTANGADVQGAMMTGIWHQPATLCC